MIQTAREGFGKLRNIIQKVIGSSGRPESNTLNPFDEQMQEPSIQEVMKSILIILGNKKHLISNLFTLKNHEELTEPFGYIFKNGGKRIRLVLAILISGLFTQDVSDKVIQMGAFIETLHTSSLIIDDIEDQSQMRRDNPCAHFVFGVRRSINSANLMYFLPLMKTLQSDFLQEEKAKFIQIYASEMITCHLGQAQDIYAHKIQREQDLPSIDQYIRMTSAKTSSLFAMLIKMMAVVLKINEQNTAALINTMRLMGISFQITDDVLNITDDLGKQRAEDFHERKFTIIIHHLRNNEEFMKLFFLKSKNPEIIEKMIQIVHRQKTVDYCKNVAFGYAEKALREIQKIKCPLSKSSFKALVKYVVERKK